MARTSPRGLQLALEPRTPTRRKPARVLRRLDPEAASDTFRWLDALFPYGHVDIGELAGGPMDAKHPVQEFCDLMVKRDPEVLRPHLADDVVYQNTDTGLIAKMMSGEDSSELVRKY